MAETKDEGRKVHWFIYFIPILVVILMIIVVGQDLAIGVPDFGLGYVQLKNVGVGLLALLYLITFILFITATSSENVVEVEPEYIPAEEAKKPKEVKKKEESKKESAEVTEKKAGKKRIIEYPKKETGCIYSNTLIPIDKNLVLNLRVFVAKSCMLCDEQEKCWAGFKNSVNYQDFMANVDCKEGFTGKAKTASQIGYFKDKEEKAKA